MKNRGMNAAVKPGKPDKSGWVAGGQNRQSNTAEPTAGFTRLEER
jgi:hypothetical protein